MGRREHLAAPERARASATAAGGYGSPATRASAFADRRHGHEHGCRRRRRYRLEARGDARGLGRRRTAGQLRRERRPVGERAVRMATWFYKNGENFPEGQRRARCRRRAGRSPSVETGRATARRHRAGIPHGRIADRLSLRGFARSVFPMARPRRPTIRRDTRRRRGRARARRTSFCATAARSSTSMAAASRCCDFPVRHRRPRSKKRRGRAACR